MNSFTALQKMAYGFATSQMVSFVSEYDQPETWFDGYLALSTGNEASMRRLITPPEDKDRESLLMDIELEADLIMLYFQELIGRVEAGVALISDGAKNIPVRDLDVHALIELGSS